MSIHPSLKIDTAGQQQRTVLTRIERIKELMRKGLWAQETNVTALPKTKIVRVKAKKKVKEEAPVGATPGAAAAPGAQPVAGASQAAAKPAAKSAADAKKK